MVEASAGKVFEKSKIIYLPFINAPPSDYETILTSLYFAMDQCSKSIQSTCIVTFDRPLYWKARDIVSAATAGTGLSKIVVRLGGFHLLMSFMGCIGSTMTGSGLQEMFNLINAENSVKHIMSGHAYSRGVRAHTLSHLSLAKQIMDSISFTEQERNFMEGAARNSDKTAIFEVIEEETAYKKNLTK